MSLAFALMAAINGSTQAPGPRCRAGSNHRTKPRRPRPGGTKDSHPSWVAAQGAARDAVAQTSVVGAKQQRADDPPKSDATRALLTASAGSARLICLDAHARSWRSITNNFRSVTFVQQRPGRPVGHLSGMRIVFAQRRPLPGPLALPRRGLAPR